MVTVMMYMDRTVIVIKYGAYNVCYDVTGVSASPETGSFFIKLNFIRAPCNFPTGLLWT